MARVRGKRPYLIWGGLPKGGQKSAVAIVVGGITPTQTWKFVADEGLVWGISAIMQPGESRTLTFGDANYAPNESNFSGIIGLNVPIYAQVDSAHTGTNFGGVLETHEIAGVCIIMSSDQ